MIARPNQSATIEGVPDGSRPVLSLVFFAVGAALAVGSGAWTMRMAGEPASLWARNIVAWIIGLGAILLLRGVRIGGTARRTLMLGAVAVLVSTLAFSGLQGVHRWLALGPVLVNGAALVLPVVVVCLLREPSPVWRGCITVAVSAVLAAQPDASQATAFAIASLIFIVLSPNHSFAARVGVSLPPVLGAFVSLLLPDPLQPVLHVEGIVQLAASRSTVMAAALLLGLVVSVCAPLVRRSSLPLVAYFATVAVAPAFGAFPVPLAGYGSSFILGQFLAVAFLSQK